MNSSTFSAELSADEWYALTREDTSYEIIDLYRRTQAARLGIRLAGCIIPHASTLSDWPTDRFLAFFRRVRDVELAQYRAIQREAEEEEARFLADAEKLEKLGEQRDFLRLLYGDKGRQYNIYASDNETTYRLDSLDGKLVSVEVVDPRVIAVIPFDFYNNRERLERLVKGHISEPERRGINGVTILARYGDFNYLMFQVWYRTMHVKDEHVK